MSRPLHGEKVNLRVFFEGVLFPYVAQVTVTDTPQQKQAQVVVPSSHMLRSEELVGMTCHIFYQNRLVRDQKARFGPNAPNRPTEWPVLFQGEMAAEGVQEGVQNEMTRLRFVSHRRHFEQTQLYHFQPDSENSVLGSIVTEVGANKEVRAFVGNSDFQIEHRGILNKATRLWSKLNQVVQQYDNEQGQNIGYAKMLVAILEAARDVHPMFRRFDEQFRLSDRFGVYADPDLKNLLGLQALRTLTAQRIKGLNTFVSLNKLLNILLQLTKYNYNQILQPQSGQQARVINDDAREYSLNQQVDKLTNPGQQYLQDEQESVFDSDPLVKQMQELVALEENAHGLREFCVLPSLEFSSPPKCNVVFPTQVNTLSYDMDYMREITRLMGVVSIGPNKDVNEVYIAPMRQNYYKLQGNRLAVMDGSLEAENDKQPVLPAGFFQGIPKLVPHLVNNSDTARQFGISIDEDSINKAIGTSEEAPSGDTAQPEVAPDATEPPEVQLDQGGLKASNIRLMHLPNTKLSRANESLSGACKRWLPLVHKWRDLLGVSAQDLPDAVMLALMQQESKGSTRPSRTGSFWGLLQEGEAYLIDASEQIQWTLGEGAYFNYFDNFPIAPQELRGATGADEVAAQKAIATTIAYMKRYKGRHNWHSDLVALTHKYPSFAKNYWNVWQRGGDRDVKNGKVSGQAAADKWLDARQADGGDGKSAGKYVKQHQVFVAKWLGEKLPPIPPGDHYQSQQAGYGTAFDRITQHEPVEGTMEPHDLLHMITPEEYRRGIVGDIYHFNEWHLAHLYESEGQKSEAEKGNAQDNSVDEGGIRADLSSDPRRRYMASVVDAEFYRRRFQARSVPALSGGFNPYHAAGFPGLIMRRQRPILGFFQSVTHTINVAAGTAQTSVQVAAPRFWDEGEVWHWIGGWSPDDLRALNKPEVDDYPTDLFGPDLRDDAAAGSERNSGENNTHSLYRKFPYWQNRLVVPTNTYNIPEIDEELLSQQIIEQRKKKNEVEGWREEDGYEELANILFDGESGGSFRDLWAATIDQRIAQDELERRATPLDGFYRHFLGCEAIDYLSNHASPTTIEPDAVKRMLVEREPGDFEVHPRTLDIREYNTRIADTIGSEDIEASEGELTPDDIGKFKPGTLAHEFFGKIDPDDRHADPESTHVDALRYNERYGVGERELMVDFLNNTATSIAGHLVYVGPTFRGENSLTSMQKDILLYIRKVSRRDIGGGV